MFLVLMLVDKYLDGRIFPKINFEEHQCCSAKPVENQGRKYMKEKKNKHTHTHTHTCEKM